MKLLKSAVVVSVIVISILKCKKRWSIATTDPSRFSNFEKIAQLKASLNNRNLNPITRFFIGVRYTEMEHEAGITKIDKKKKSPRKRESS